MVQRYISDDEEPLEDDTAVLELHSKRTEREKRKQAKRDKKRNDKANITRLPVELILQTLELLRPSDVFSFSHVNHCFHSVVLANANAIGDKIIRQRYSILSRCFPLPVTLADIDPMIQSLLKDPKRQNALNIHKRPYAHVEAPNPQELCTCLTCILTWNNLGLALDFAHWQDNLDSGEPIPTLPRGQIVKWNQTLVERNARTIRKAVHNSLYHAYILETHLDSTIRSIRRHQKNFGNRRKHVEMDDNEAASGTDLFLEKTGPLSLEFPFVRDEYYMLEAYLPNRWWKKMEHRWVYTIEGQHERDLALVVRFARPD